MSLVSIYSNKEIIADKIKELQSLPFTSDWQLAAYVISECMSKQYEMMRNNLNLNMIEKRFFDQNLCGSRLKDALYQHIYSHNHIALTDEIFEVKDAVTKYFSKLDAGSDTFMTELLILEEYIDTFHFILEYTALLEEHYLISLFDNNKFTVDNLNYYYVGNNRFSRQVNDMIKVEGSHIISYLYDTNQINTQLSDNTILDNMMKLNREFIRRCNFKDWKKYPEDFYSPAKFAELFKINRDMYSLCINGIANYIDTMSFLLDQKPVFNSESIKDVLSIMYGLYMAKREENIRRQNNDPRYTGKAEGNIIGIEVK
jgi:hypothetical protein